MTSHADLKAISRTTDERIFTALEYLNAVGIALSQEKDITRLLENILTAAKNITNADGGTLYRLNDDKLNFEIVFTEILRQPPDDELTFGPHRLAPPGQRF